MINALRMRPDRIVVGEVRGGEALDMLQAMNTGHDGSLTTAHSNSPRDTLHRVETMVLMAGMDLPLRAVREQIASAFDLIVHLERLSDGTPQDRADHRSAGDGGRRHRHAGHLPLCQTGVTTIACRAISRPPASGPSSWTRSKPWASFCRPAFLRPRGRPRGH